MTLRELIDQLEKIAYDYGGGRDDYEVYVVRAEDLEDKPLARSDIQVNDGYGWVSFP